MGKTNSSMHFVLIYCVMDTSIQNKNIHLDRPQMKALDLAEGCAWMDALQIHLQVCCWLLKKHISE